MRRQLSPSRSCALPVVQRRQHAEEAPSLGLIMRLGPQHRDGIRDVGPRAGDGLASELGPLWDLVGEGLGDGRRGEDAVGWVSGRSAVVEQGGEDLCRMWVSKWELKEGGGQG